MKNIPNRFTLNFKYEIDKSRNMYLENSNANILLWIILIFNSIRCRTSVVVYS